jgi:hypothetical protein
MNAVKCPECGAGFDEKEFHWVTNADGGVMYRLPCDHMVVGTWKEGVVTYGSEHAWTRPAQPGHAEHHHHDHHHHHFLDDIDRILDQKLHEQ